MKKVLTLKKILTFVLAVFMFVPALAFTGCIQDGLDETKPVAKSKYRITLSTSASAAGTVDGAGVYEEGSVITIRAIANNNYTFSKWGDGNTDNPRTITVTSNKSYKAYFNYTGNCQVSVSILSVYQGQIIKDEVYGHVEGTGSYKAGSSVTLKAVPEEGCFFVGWGDGCLDAEREISSISANVDYRAQFVKADAVYVHEATGYYAAIVGECTISFTSKYVCFTPSDNKNFIGWYAGTNEMIFASQTPKLGIYFTDFTKNHFYTLVKTVIGRISVHAPSSEPISNIKSDEGDWTYLTDLEEYVAQKGFMMIYFTDSKRTEPTSVEERSSYTLYNYEIDCNKYVNYALYSVYETSKGVCVDRSSFGTILQGNEITSSYYYKGEKLSRVRWVGVK